MLNTENILHADFQKDNKESKKHTTLKPPELKVAPFNSNLLPEPISKWVQDSSKRANMPADYMAAAIIVSASILIAHKLTVHPKQHDDWEVHPNLWGFLIGEPSSGKSPMLQKGLAPIKNIGKKQAASPTRKRVFAYDATIEKLGKILSTQDNGILLTRDEFDGLLQSLSKKGYENARSFFLEAFNGNSEYIFDRISHDTIIIPNLCISILGGLQPSVLNSIIAPAISGIRNDGLIQRFQVSVWPDKLAKNYVDEKPDISSKEKVETLFLSLWDHIESSEKRAMRFSPEAQILFEEFSMQHETQTHLEANPVLEEHFCKYPSLLASLALIFQVFEDVNSKTISVTSFEYAHKWINYLASHARKMYGVQQYKSYENANKLIRYRERLPPSFSIREIKQKHWGGLANYQDIQAAIEILLNNDVIKTAKIAIRRPGRKPSPRYEWR